jgi:Tfp pilus assembly protein PilO
LLTKFNQIPVADKKSIDTVLPNSLDFVKLISQIDSVAGSQGIMLDKINSRETDSSVGESVAEAKPARPYHSAIISFSFTTTYEKFNVFMAALEKSLRILDVKSLKIEALENGLYIYSVDLETYWLKI